MDIAKKIAEELGIKTEQVNAVIKLIEEGNSMEHLMMRCSVILMRGLDT